MADTKISGLPASTTPLAGTEILPIVQSGVTKKVSVADVLGSVQSGGVANGVQYLNGSKISTSSSNFAFDGGSLYLGTTVSTGVINVAGNPAGNNVGVYTEQSSNTTINNVDNHFNANTKYNDFRWYGSSIGSISNSGGAAVVYATTSDYRLKENIAPMVGALNKLDQLNPVTYNWISTKTKAQGFIAHELQAVVPDCVVGDKDAVDDEGNPVYQSIDTSFLVATLTAALKELNAKFEAYVATHP